MHFGVLTHLLWCADRQQPAIVDRHNPVCDLADEIHVVLNHNQRDAEVDLDVFEPERNVIGFFVAAVADTSLVWLLSAIAIAVMTLPNLFTMLVLHKEMKLEIDKYWEKFHRENPQSKIHVK